MLVNVQHWDVFTRNPGKGNPAGIVIVDNNLHDDDMQNIANKVGFNDTVFILPSHQADFRLRYFSPRREVELCGHATIAAFSALNRHRLLPSDDSIAHYSFETKSGVLPIAVENVHDDFPLIIMGQGIARFAEFTGAVEALTSAIGIAPTDLHPTLPIIYGSTGRWTLVVPVRGLEVMRRMRPYQERFVTLLADKHNASIHPFCLETINANACLHARHFSSAASGTLEDAVTGTASGVLGAYYRRYICRNDRIELPLLIEQGYEVSREGIVQVWAEGKDNGYDVRVAGAACFVENIEITLP